MRMSLITSTVWFVQFIIYSTYSVNMTFKFFFCIIDMHSTWANNVTTFLVFPFWCLPINLIFILKQFFPFFRIFYHYSPLPLTWYVLLCITLQCALSCFSILKLHLQSLHLWLKKGGKIVLIEFNGYHQQRRRRIPVALRL